MKTLFLSGVVALSLLSSGAASAEPASPIVGLFAQGAAKANDFEIAEAKIVLQDSTDPKVRAMAQQMMHDHVVAQADLTRAARPSGVSTAFVFDVDRQKLVDDLGLMDSPKLDQTYLDDQVAAHAQAVALLEDYARHGDDQSLRAYARRTLPVVRLHQEMLADMTGRPASF